MDRRRAAGALLALAACIATTAAAPTASNQTALDVYDGPSEGCYYNFQHYGEGDRIMTNEPCLNCTCHNRMLMCYLRVCPFTKPIGQDCSVEKRADQCCPIVTCPDVPVDLLTSTSTSSPAEYGETGIGKLDRYGCSINGKYFPEGSKVPPTPNKPCEHCYCIRNMTTCVMQECTLHVDGCTPIYRKDVCCPVRYSCDHPEDEIPLLDDMTTTVRPTPGFILTTTTIAPVTQMTQDCVHDDKVFVDGALIKTEKACEHCYCMKGDIVCVVQECGTPMENEGKKCTSMPPREGQCCPDTYICEGDELTTEAKPDIETVTSGEDLTTLSPPRRVSVEGSGYRSETDEPLTEVPTFAPELEPDNEGSGEEQQPVKPTDVTDILPEDETPLPFITTGNDDNVENYSPSTTKSPDEITERATTEPDKGENTVPSGGIDEDVTGASIEDETTPEIEITTSKPLVATESPNNLKTTIVQEDSDVKHEITSHDEMVPTAPTSLYETTAGHELSTSQDNRVTTEGIIAETTLPTRRKEDGEEKPTEMTTVKNVDDYTTKASDFITPETLVTESATSPIVDLDVQTSPPQLPEVDNEVLVKETTTDANLETTTKSDEIETETKSATAVQPEINTEPPTPGKVELIDTTSANPIENEIDEESFPTLAPGRIPGEGDCLLDGVTYSHESIVPSSNNCHTSCKCISSIVKCDPIICSPPPDYMDNCQPMYDSPESCCPTYVCDHPKETVPPQSHSQMAGTESPIPTPTIHCDGDQCEIIKDKEDAKPNAPCSSGSCTDDLNNKPEECGTQGCAESDKRPEEYPSSKPTEECAGDSCLSPQDCTDGKCKSAVPKEQTCNNENGCEIPVIEACEGNDCTIQTDSSTSKDEPASCDNPENCKHAQVPEKIPDCEGNTCVPKSPPEIIPQEKQDCKDGDDCVLPNQTPITEECKEESCRRQEVPDTGKPATDCNDNECKQQEHIQQNTVQPEVNTESILGVTESPEGPETKTVEPVTDSPKTPAAEKEGDQSEPTEASISEKEPVSVTTPQYDDIDDKEKEHQTSAPESPEIVTNVPDVQQNEYITDNNIERQTTTSPLQDHTKADDMLPEISSSSSEFPATEKPSLTDKDTNELTTVLPGIADTKLPEAVTKPIEDTVLDDEHSMVTNAPVDEVKDKDTIDITTPEPSLPGTSPEFSQKTTDEPQEILTESPESFNKDDFAKTTKEPDYSHDTEPKVTESTEGFTGTPEQISTDKVEVEPSHEQKQEEAPTTKSYDSSTGVPEKLDTESPVIIPETQTTLPQEQEEELQASEKPTDKPDDMPTDDRTSSDSGKDTVTSVPVFDSDESTTKSSLDESITSHVPELGTTTNEEPSTTAPLHEDNAEPGIQKESSKPDISLSQDATSENPDNIATEVSDEGTSAPVTVTIQTETPMSIVKDHSNDEKEILRTPESEISTERDATTKKSELPEVELSQTTESYIPTSEVTPEPVSGIEIITEKDMQMTEKSVTDQETTTSPILKDKLPTMQPVQDSEITGIPDTETSTDNMPVSVSIVNEPITSKYPEPTETENKVSVYQEESSESAPTIPNEHVETVSPDSATESPVQHTSEQENITPAQEQSNENIDATDLPELTIHEHPTDPSIATQPVAEEAATKMPDTTITEPQETIPAKDATDAPMPQDSATQVTEVPLKESDSEKTTVLDQEFVTNTPDLTQPEKTEPKPDENTHLIPEQTSTESQNESTETPKESVLTTAVPVITETSDQKEATEGPVSEDAVVTNAPKIAENYPQETATGVDSQDTVTNVPVEFVTEPNKDITGVPTSHDFVTKPSDTATESHQDSTNVPEILDMEPHKDLSKTETIATEVPQVTTTDSSKEVTETSQAQDTTTKLSEISPAVPHEETTKGPDSQDETTSVPKISVTEPGEEITNIPYEEAVVTHIPVLSETEPTKDVTQASTYIPEKETHVPELDDTATIVPEISVTEGQKETTVAPTKEDTSSNVPGVNDIESQTDSTETLNIQETSTKVPETFITESQTEPAHIPESQETTTNAPELSDTMKETTLTPESLEGSSTLPEILETETKKSSKTPDTYVTTDSPFTPVTEVSDEPSILSETEKTDSKAPELTTTESLKEVSNAPEIQDVATSTPEISPTEPQKQMTESQEIPEEPVTESRKVLPESQDMVTDFPEKSITETERETSTSVSPAAITSVPEKSDTEPNKEPELESVTVIPQRTQTEIAENELKTEEPTVTDKGELSTEAPLKITTKLDGQTEPQLIVMQTESSVIELETSVPTESGLPVEKSTKLPDLLTTQSIDKIADSDKPSAGEVEEDKEGKPQDGQEITTEAYFEEPTTKSEYPKTDTATESILSTALFESDTKPPEVSDTERPEVSVTVKPDFTLTPESESTRPAETEVQEDVTKTTEKPEQTSEAKDELPETTPYLVLLEEHTHKKDIYTTAPDGEITTSSPYIPQKEYEPSTPEVSIDAVTESVQSTESEKQPQEVGMSNKDQSVSEISPAVTEIVTEPLLVLKEITTASPSSESLDTEKPQEVESNDISTSAPTRDEVPTDTENPVATNVDTTERDVVSTTEKPHETTAPEEEFILATTKTTTLKVEESTTLSPIIDKFGKPEEVPKPITETEKPKPDTTEDISKPGTNEVQPTEEALQPDDDSHFPPSGTSGYGQEPDYGEEDSFGPGTCRYGGKVYVSAQQIPRDDPCDFCFCFRSDIICLQQSCPPPIHGCHEEPIQGFCCPRYECPVSMATTLNVTTTTTTTTTTLPPHFLPHAYKGAAQRRGCQIKGHTYKVGEVVRASSGPCLHCTCGGDGQMKCDPKVCTPEPMLRQMIAAAVSAKRRR